MKQTTRSAIVNWVGGGYWKQIAVLVCWLTGQVSGRVFKCGFAYTELVGMY